MYYIIIILFLLLLTYFFINKKKKIIVLCLDIDYIYLKEYIESNFRNNELQIYDKNNGRFSDENVYYMCIRRIPYLPNTPEIDMSIILNSPGKDFLDIFPCHIYTGIPKFTKNCKIGFLNVEQYSDPIILNFNKKYLLPNIDIYDYSLKNIKIYGKGIYLPYKENEDETKLLQSFMNVNKEVDVSIVGSKFERRDIIVEKLLANNKLHRTHLSKLWFNT